MIDNGELVVISKLYLTVLKLSYAEQAAALSFTGKKNVVDRLMFNTRLVVMHLLHYDSNYFAASLAPSCCPTLALQNFL